MTSQTDKSDDQKGDVKPQKDSVRSLKAERSMSISQEKIGKPKKVSKTDQISEKKSDSGLLSKSPSGRRMSRPEVKGTN